jgi:transcriptional regulator with XRE-family HTH domain
VYLLDSTLTIRNYLQQYLKSNNISLNQFAELANINAGTLSNIINNKRPIAVQQLDQITTAMGFEEGHFYEIYVKECFEQETPDWRRLGPLLRRCTDVNKLDYVEEILKQMLDNLSYVPLLFEMAEEFFSEGKNEAAILLYECISESERAQHSERLALCQYRLFTLRLSDDQENNLIVATYFEPYIERLDEAFQLDAINELLNINVSLRRWAKVEKNAKSLLDKASKQYKFFGRNNHDRTTHKPLIFYVLYSYLAYGHVYFNLEQYDRALEYVKKYADASWVKDPDQEEKVVIEQFSEWSEANYFMYGLAAGHVELLPAYVDYIAVREKEIFTGLYNIVSAANRYDIGVDAILERFAYHIKLQIQESRIGKISTHVTLDHYTDFTRELAVYHLKRKKFDKGINYLLDSLASAIKINNDNAMVRCMGLYEKYRCFTSISAQVRYGLLIKEVLDINEKKTS